MDIFYTDIEKFYSTMTPVQTDEFIGIYGQKFGSGKRSKEHALGRFLVKYIAKNFYNKENTDIDIKQSKPYFTSNSDLNFSISHSRNIVLAGFDTKPVGVDIEVMKPRNIKEILAHLNIKNDNVSPELFYRYWTAYEAKIKLQSTPKSYCTVKLLPEFMLSVLSGESLDINKMLRIYELASPNASINPSELINLKLVNASSRNENTVVIQEINTASLEFFEPLNLNIA